MSLSFLPSLSLLTELCAKLQDTSSTDPATIQLWKDFRLAISTMYLHAKARGAITTNHSMTELPENERQGEMRGFGFRSAKLTGRYQRGKKIGMLDQTLCS